jgi:hypothetical protein
VFDRVLAVVTLHGDQASHHAIVGLDDALEVGQERSITAPVWVVRAPEPPGDASLAAPLGQEQLTFGAILTCQVCAPAPGVGETDAIQRLQPQSTSPHRSDRLAWGSF